MSPSKFPKKKKDSSRNSDGAEVGLASILLSSLRGAVFALAVSCALAFAFCAAALASADPDALLFPLSMIALYISSFLGGFISARRNGGSKLICGIVSGGIFMLMYMFISLFFPSEMASGYNFAVSLLLHALIIVFSILGAFSYRKKTTYKRKRSVR